MGIDPNITIIVLTFPNGPACQMAQTVQLSVDLTGTRILPLQAVMFLHGPVMI